MPELLILVVGLVLAGAIVLAPLRRPAAEPADDEHEAALTRHRVALEALRDVEADHHSGALDEAAYTTQLAEAEADAAATRAAVEAAPPAPQRSGAGAPGRTAAMVAAGVIGLVLVGGSLVEATGIGNATVLNQSLAAAQAAEAARQARIGELLPIIAADPSNTSALSDLADAYLAGSSGDDLFRAALTLQALISMEPGRADAYERLMTAYLRAGDYGNARATHDSYVELAAADPVEAAFFDGLIARGESDSAAAVAAFDHFLELAPDDPRTAMIRGLRAEEAAAASPSP